MQDLFALESQKQLDKQNDPAISFIGIGGLDAICHHFWKYRFPKEFDEVSPEGVRKFGELIDNYYRFLDGKIEKTVKESGVDNVLIISDHGFESAKSGDIEGISGNHLTPPKGIFLAKGPHIRNVGEIELRSLDVVPTLLHLLGIPIGKDMPGVVEKTILTDAYRKSTPVKKIDSWEDKGEKLKKAVAKSEAEEKMKERLKALGYIE